MHVNYPLRRKLPSTSSLHRNVISIKSTRTNFASSYIAVQGVKPPLIILIFTLYVSAGILMQVFKSSEAVMSDVMATAGWFTVNRFHQRFTPHERIISQRLGSCWDCQGNYILPLWTTCAGFTAGSVTLPREGNLVWNRSMIDLFITPVYLCLAENSQNQNCLTVMETCFIDRSLSSSKHKITNREIKYSPDHALALSLIPREDAPPYRQAWIPSRMFETSCTS